MPVAPYDNLESVLNTARTRLNDAIALLSGDVLKDIAVFTPAIVTAAWRRLQEQLAFKGWQGLNRETVLPSVPAVTPTTDYGSQVWFNWVNYFDGTTTQAAPVLPQDMIAPIELLERVHGVLTNYIGMDQCFNGIPNVAKGALNRLWEWRQETVYMPGATGLTDIRMRYSGYLADFLIGVQTTLSGNINNAVTAVPVIAGTNIANGNYIQIDSEIMLVTAGGGTTTLTATRAQLGTAAAAHTSAASVIVLPNAIPVPIMRSLNSFAWFICSEMARARGDMDSGYFDQQAMTTAEYIFNRDYRGPKSLFKGAELGKMGDPNTPTDGPEGKRGKE